MPRRLISQMHPWLYTTCVETHRLKRDFVNIRKKISSNKAKHEFAYRCTSHQSVLMRKLGDINMDLQVNKITNLRLAANNINRVIIEPGETFSLWKLIGRPTVKKGYLEGMVLKDGEAKSDIGGGLCQMANLLYWMVLHTPLIVTERHHHSFDAFPDSGRVLPFGSGATIFYNYLDLQFYNPTNITFQFNVWVTDVHLKGEIRADKPMDHAYHVLEKNHQYLFNEMEKQYYRANSLWRVIADRKTGNNLKEELICTNFSRMKYEPPKDSKIKRFGFLEACIV